ncbi:MAG: DMT family transporter [Clostridia bacterium]|nr:DMT family transporter [Clostridia bacterium]
MWFTYSLLTIFAWGGSDLFTKMGTDPNDNLSHWRVVIMVGVVMGLHATGVLLFSNPGFTLMDVIAYLPVSFMYILSMVLGYAGLRYIELSVSSPVCNSSGAVAAVLCFLFLGQTMEGIQIAAVVMISGALVALAVLERRYSIDEINKEDKKYRYGLLALIFPLLYCVIDGVGSTMDAYFLENIIDEDRANIAYEYTFLVAAAFSYVYLRFIKKRRFRFFEEKKFALGAICETAGQFTYIRAMSENAIVAAPMIASYSVFSMILSRIFLKEKLKTAQYIAIAVVMAGIFILGME